MTQNVVRLLTPDEAATSHQEALDAGDLLIWTITNSPNEYPDLFVARPFSVRLNMEVDEVLTARTLQDLRAAMPPNLIRSDKSSTEDPNIVEFWM